MDIYLLTISVSVLAMAISVYAAVPVGEKQSRPIKRKPREQLPAEVLKLIENVDELDRIAKSL